MSDNVVPFEHPWDEDIILNVGKVTVGGTPSTANPRYWDGDIPWMSSGDVHMKRINDVPGRITKLGLDSSNATMVNDPAVAIALAGQGKTRGTAALTEIPICTNQSVALIQGDEFKLLTTYLFHALDFRYEELRGRSAGGGRAGLSKGILESVPVPLPKPDEQQTMTNILNNIDTLIQQTESKIEKLTKIKTGLMQDLLIKGIDENGQIRKSIFNDFVPVSVLAEINPSTSLNDLDDTSLVSFIPMADVSNDGLWINKQVATLKDVRSGFTRFQENDVLFSKITPCMENGKATYAENLVNGVGFGTTEFHVLRAKNGIAPRYIYHWIMTKELRQKAEARMTGTAGQKRVPADFFDKFFVPKFEIEEQNTIVQILDTQQAHIECEKMHLLKLKLIKQGLMQDLLTGTKLVPKQMIKGAVEA